MSKADFIEYTYNIKVNMYKQPFQNYSKQIHSEIVGNTYL